MSARLLVSLALVAAAAATARADSGEDLYGTFCARCHDSATDEAPNLRASEIPGDAEAFAPVVLEGLEGTRMQSFAVFLSEGDVEAIRRYLVGSGG